MILSIRGLLCIVLLSARGGCFFVIDTGKENECDMLKIPAQNLMTIHYVPDLIYEGVGQIQYCFDFVPKGPSSEPPRVFQSQAQLSP